MANSSTAEQYVVKMKIVCQAAVTQICEIQVLDTFAIFCRQNVD